MRKSLLIGGAMVDVMLYLPQLPVSGGDLLAKGGQHIMGGCAMNVAQILQHFGCAFDLCVPLGVGKNARFIAEELAKERWHTLIQSDQADNGVCYTLVEPSGERSFVTVPGIEETFQPEWLQPIDARQYEQIYLGGYECVSRGGDTIIEWLQSQVIPQLFFCPGPVVTDIGADRLQAICAFQPILHLNRHELYAWTQKNSTQEAMQQLANWTNNAPVVVTAGAEGAYLYESGTLVHIPSTAQVVVDTSGAGDAHIGAIMAALAKGQDLLSAVQQANQISAFVVQHVGPRPHSQFSAGVIL